MMAAYEIVLTSGEREHANRCEMLDEIEEWMLIMKHYCFVIAASTSTGLDSKDTDNHCENIAGVGGERDVHDDSNCCHRDISEKLCSTDLQNPLGLVKSRCLSQKSTRL